jgi:hypothetical protein
MPTTRHRDSAGYFSKSYFEVSPVNRFKPAIAGIFVVILSSLVISCSRQAPPEPAAATQPAAPVAAPAAQPAAQSAAAPAAEPAPSATPAEPSSTMATTAAKPAGPPATEKHSLSLANYAKTAVTVSLNGAWIGQWDSNTSVPLDQVVVGKNDLTVELADTPKNELRLEVWTKRDGQDVNLLRLNFQDKANGTYKYAFAAR